MVICNYQREQTATSLIKKINNKNMTTNALKKKFESQDYEMTKKGKYLFKYRGKTWLFYKKDLDFYLLESNRNLKISEIEMPCL